MGRWLLRVFASAVVRRVAYLVVASICALFAFSGRASAMDQGEAYVACEAALAGYDTPIATRNKSCKQGGAPGALYFDAYFEYDTYGDGRWQVGSVGTFGWADEASCSARPPQYGWLADSQHTQACYQGCGYDSTLDVSSGAKYYAATGSVCTPSDDAPPPKIDTDGDGVPDDQDAFPNDPNESKDSDGDGIGDNADVAPNDPTNGDDKEDGDEKDNQAGGGGDCNAPPTCSGDAIACNTNWQIWRLRCGNGGAVTGDVTNCAASYTCNADPVQCAQLAVMRKNACKADGTGNGESGTGQPDWTKGGEPARPADTGDDAEPRLGIGLSTDMLNREELFGSTTCPALPAFKVMGTTISPSDFPWWCTLVSIMRGIVLLMAGYTAIQILLGRVV